MQLILFFSKSLLRLPKAKSSLSEIVDNTHFQRYLPETSQGLVPGEHIRRHVLCSGECLHIHISSSSPNVKSTSCFPGQVYYTLLQEREAKGIKDVAISRVEQISPFPYDLVCSLLAKLGMGFDRFPGHSAP